MKGELKTYSSYGNIYQSTAEVFYPKTLEELRAIVAFCKKEDRHITPAGSFHSFDRQNASRDVVISMRHFDTVTCDPEAGTLTTGAGASWGKIFDEAFKNHCLLYTCITGSAPTAGGTLSINSYSIWSPGAGREAEHCLSFQLMTTEGELLTCSRTEHEDLFRGVIGGMGFLGFIVSITYRVLSVGSPVEIEIEMVDYDDIDHIEQRLPQRKASDLSQLENLRSQTTLFYTHKNQPLFLVANRRYKRVPQDKKGNRWAFLGAVLACGIIRSFPNVANVFIAKDKGKPSHKRSIVKHLTALRPGIFWVDPDYHWATKFSRFFQWLGYEPKLYQNSYFIPTGGERVTTFTKRIYALKQQYQLESFMFDVTYIPKDDVPFVLSCSKHTDGFYVTTTFMERTNREDLLACYATLNHLVIELGGSFNLSKNCFIEPALLEQMYATSLVEFKALKDKYDPTGRITSDFFEQYFPSYFGKNQPIVT